MKVGDLVKLKEEQNNFVGQTSYVSSIVLKNNDFKMYVDTTGVIIKQNKIINLKASVSINNYIFQVMWPDNNMSYVHPANLIVVSTNDNEEAI